MSDAVSLLVAVAIVGVLLVLVDVCRRPQPDEVDVGRLGRGVLVTAMILLVLVLGARIANAVLTPASPGDTAPGSQDGWSWWPLGATCRDSISGTDEVHIPGPGWSPTVAVIVLVVASVALVLSARRHRRRTTKADGQLRSTEDLHRL